MNSITDDERPQQGICPRLERTHQPIALQRKG